MLWMGSPLSPNIACNPWRPIMSLRRRNPRCKSSKRPRQHFENVKPCVCTCMLLGKGHPRQAKLLAFVALTGQTQRDRFDGFGSIPLARHSITPKTEREQIHTCSSFCSLHMIQWIGITPIPCHDGIHVPMPAQRIDIFMWQTEGHPCRSFHSRAHIMHSHLSKIWFGPARPPQKSSAEISGSICSQ